MSTRQYVSSSKASAMKFLDTMFRDRLYDMKTKQIIFVPEKQLWEIFINDDKGDPVMCVLTTVCENFKDSLGIEEFVLEHADSRNENPFEGTKPKKVKKTNTGRDFLMSVISYAEENGIKQIIIVSDSITFTP